MKGLVLTDTQVSRLHKNLVLDKLNVVSLATPTNSFLK